VLFHQKQSAFPLGKSLCLSESGIFVGPFFFRKAMTYAILHVCANVTDPEASGAQCDKSGTDDKRSNNKVARQAVL